ncbi:prolyl oligopeptidase family serine peptidase [soil metagenome]
MDPHAAFPAEYARTRRFTLGRPRGFRVAPDGSRVTFLRSADGQDPLTGLWVLDVATGRERLVADPARLGAGVHGDPPPEERARRERTRESAAGVVAYATDRALGLAAFALGGELFVAGLDPQPAAADTALRLAVDPPVVDPRPDPTGRRVAYVSGGALHVADLGGEQGGPGGVGGGYPVRVAGENDPTVTWGLAEFVAAEEMGRIRGFWWSPDGSRLAVARVDTSTVARWTIADPVDPAKPAATVSYPAAGTANAQVSLHVVEAGGQTGQTGMRVDWDAGAFPYLVDVTWEPGAPLTLVVQSRDQRRLRVLAADPAGGGTRLVREDTDPVWVDIVPGVPRWLPDGRLVHTVDAEDTRRLAVDGRAITPPGLQVRRLVDVDGGRAVVTASTDPTAVGVYEVPLEPGPPLALSAVDGVCDAVAGGGVTVVVSADMRRHGAEVRVHGPKGPVAVPSRAATPPVEPNVEFLRLGERGLRAALVLPRTESEVPLPVLLDPYGGPHAQRVVRARDAYLVSQWFADAGFAVLVADGRGTPGRGPAWERTVAGDLATAPLDDQVEALGAAAALHPRLDMSRVAVRGWSFGGYLAALAVLRRPDVFHAAVAGAPVSDWTLYDTHYTERYLGLPAEPGDRYRASSLLADAPSLRRPLLLVHGMSDDNVVAAHTLRLSRALLEAGRPHAVLPLSGVTHMTPQSVVEENLLWLQLDFLRRALAA